MAEPTENTYVVTIVLRGVKKAQALEFAECAKNSANYYTHMDKVEVFTAHLKDEA